MIQNNEEIMRNNTKKLRDSNIEMLRIVAMFLVVLSHFVEYGLMKQGYDSTYKVWAQGCLARRFISSFCVLGPVGVGLFFMISGYFLVEKKGLPSLKKIVTSTVFYAWIAIIAGIIQVKFGEVQIGTVSSAATFLALFFTPVSGSIWWFITAYVVLIGLTPVLNKVVSELNRHGMLILLFSAYFFGYICGRFNSHVSDVEIAVFFYLLGAYFKVFESKNGVGNFTLTAILLSALLIEGFLQLQGSDSMAVLAEAGMKKKIISTLWYAVVPALVIPLFCLFQRMKIKNNRIINTVAAHTLGIYLFHLSPFVKDFLFYNLIDEAGIYNSEFFFVYLFIVPLLIFIGCLIVDVVKSVCYEKPLLKWIEKHEEQFCSRFVKTFS